MPPSKKDRQRRKQAAASFNVKNPSWRTANHNHLKNSAFARSTATVPPNISLPADTLTTVTNASTIISVASTSSPTPRNTSNTITADRFPIQNPEVRLPISTNERTGDHSGNQDNDDVIYLYTVDPGPAQRLADEVDLTQESEAEKPGPSNETATKPRKNRKRKLEEDEATRKRKTINDAQLICSVCNFHKESLIRRAEQMLLGSCGHLFCAPCTRKIKANECKICGKKINALRKVFI